MPSSLAWGGCLPSRGPLGCSSLRGGPPRWPRWRPSCSAAYAGQRSWRGRRPPRGAWGGGSSGGAAAAAAAASCGGRRWRPRRPPRGARVGWPRCGARLAGPLFVQGVPDRGAGAVGLSAAGGGDVLGHSIWVSHGRRDVGQAGDVTEEAAGGGHGLGHGIWVAHGRRDDGQAGDVTEEEPGGGWGGELLAAEVPVLGGALRAALGDLVGGGVGSAVRIRGPGPVAPTRWGHLTPRRRVAFILF